MSILNKSVKNINRNAHWLGLLAICLQSTTCPIAAAQQALPIHCQTLGSPTIADTQQVGRLQSISLPALAPSPFKSHPALQSQFELHGFASVSVGVPDPNQLIDRLVETALARDAAKAFLADREHYHNKKRSRVIARSRDMLQYMTSYQGFESSSEAADVILEEKLKLKSPNAVEFVKQKRLDAAHLQLTLAIIELATALGLADEQKRQEAITNGLHEMVPLVGEDEANESLELLNSWSKSVSPIEASTTHEPWDVLALRQKSLEVLVSSLSDDKVVRSVEARLHRYNHISNFSRATSKIVNTSLSIASLTPTFVSPAAQALQFIYIACTGGPEEKKLLKEVYLDRCFDSRFDRLNQETMLIVDNNNNAVLTHNAVLFCCTELMIKALTDAHSSADTPAVNAAVSSPEPRGIAHKSFGERI